MAIDKANRYCTAGSHFFIHQSKRFEAVNFNGSLGARQELLTYQIAEVRMEQEMLDWSKNLYVKNTDISAETIEEIMGDPKPIDADEALRLGLVRLII